MLPKLFMLAISLLMLWIHEAQASLAKPGCQERCGNLTIPYPYGIGIGCYMHNSFQVSCHKSSSDSDVPHLQSVNNNSLPILKISMESIRVVAASPYSCNGSRNTSTHSLDPHFRYSHKRNVYIAAGCNISATFLSIGQGHLKEVGCASNCTTAADNGSFTCNGTNGCCQSNIPIETSIFQSFIFNHAPKAPCNYAFIVEKEYAQVRTIHKLVYDANNFPLTLNWVVTLFSCHQDRRRGDNICGHNSRCVDSTKGAGYNCHCRKGYSGNPYLPTGCQDINECLNHTDHHCREDQICINMPGSYKCTSQHGHISIISGIIVTVIVIFVLGVIGHWTYKEHARRKGNRIKEEFFKRNGGYLLKHQISSNKSHVMKIKIYSAKVIENATDSFSQNRLLGKGGQGTVYKGILTDGTVVAIKKSNVVDEDQVERFVNEIIILAQINHRNIVKLLGCCLQYEVPLLIYEYLSNGTLSQHLHDGEEVSKFTWKDRIEVARDVAGALLYLHSYASPAICHRDVKPHNILLDANYKALISDFGLSKLIPLSRSHLTTQIEGTLGYLDPEYFLSGKLTEKSDVYAFGVVLAELLTKRKVVSSTDCGEGLIPRFQFLVKHNRVLEILDKQVLDEAPMDDILLVTKLTKTCMENNVKRRPYMKDIVMELDKLKAV